MITCESRKKRSRITALTDRVGSMSAYAILNMGSRAWVKGTETQVDLAACLEDKATCDRQDAADARFDPGTWVSATRYATQAQRTVSPGQIGTFMYDVKVPADQAAVRATVRTRARRGFRRTT